MSIMKGDDGRIMITDCVYHKRKASDLHSAESDRATLDSHDVKEPANKYQLMRVSAVVREVSIVKWIFVVQGCYMQALVFRCVYV